MPDENDKPRISVGISIGNGEEKQLKAELVSEEEFKESFDSINKRKDKAAPVSLDDLLDPRKRR